MFTVSKAREDHWGANPPRVSTYLMFFAGESSTESLSPPCGFGWRFSLSKTRVERATNGLKKRHHYCIHVTLEPHLCGAMNISPVSITIAAKFSPTLFSRTEEHNDVSIKGRYRLGTYDEPVYSLPTAPWCFEITLLFNPQDGLSFPQSVVDVPKPFPFPIVTKAVHDLLLGGPLFFDIKFYLYSARSGGRVTHPKAVYANSILLLDSCSYVRNLLSDTNFGDGIRCNLWEDPAEVLNKLSEKDYDYESDSDLDSEPDQEAGLKENRDDEPDKEGDPVTGSQSISDLPPGTTSFRQDGRVYSINGTAFKTWNVFIFWVYTGQVYFNPLRSMQKPKPVSEIVRCSPKSLYRLADYVDLPQLRKLAKEGIEVNLYKTNIVEELFSHFTSKYDELIELEVDFLVKNFSSQVERDFDNTIQMMLSGERQHCSRALAFALKRLRGRNAQQAWEAIAPHIK